MSAAWVPRLRARNLTLRAGPHLVCEGLHFEACAGQLVHVQGDSGRGKSTLLQAILGLGPIAGGEVQRFVDARQTPLHSSDPSLSAWRAQHVGVVLQRGHVFAELTVADHFARSGAAPQAVHAALARFGLAHRQHAVTRTLSGGEQRRLAVARALCVPRTLLVLDEPTEGLDADNACHVWQAIGACVQAGAAALVASHDAALQALPSVLPLPLAGATR